MISALRGNTCMDLKICMNYADETVLEIMGVYH